MAVMDYDSPWKEALDLAPNIAEPTRTSVAPSAIAVSRSADMPMDSVSSVMPAAFARPSIKDRVRS